MKLIKKIIKKVKQPSSSNRRRHDGPRRRLQHDPHFREVLPFHEYFDGDTGEGLGASHQTGWTALVATHLSISDPGVADEAASPPDRAAASSSPGRGEE